MAEELFIPKLGQTVEEVTLLNWLVKDGEKVEQGQEVLEVETDKAVFNVEAVDSGYIHIGPYKAGQVVPVLEIVALIGKKDEIFKAPASQLKTSLREESVAVKEPSSAAPEFPGTGISGAKLAAQKLFSSPRARKLANEKKVDIQAVTPTGGGGVRVRESDVTTYLSQTPKASPVAQKMAEEAGLNLKSVPASGPRDEITRADVELALARRSAPPQNVAAAQTPALPLPEMEITERLPLKGVRGVIAERMGASSRATARVTLLMDVDATDFVTLREKLKAAHENDWGFAPGYNDLLAKACACALRRFPYMNTRLNGNVIERLARVNIGIAVDAEKGLYVPVIRDVDQKDLQTIGSEFRQRVDEIRSNKILPEALSGGSFTITNLGMYDVDGFTPVINLPEAAILGVGRITPKPVVRDDQIVVRKIMTLSLAFDHRLVDGAPAAKFLQYIKELIETPGEVTLTR
ncbi:MAG: 2-oxo acid dehydrogenase subunit E2 [Anaerolineaceae bacterium]|nr:2-oxo acid dehydrogenase subunit E2 [Anaerolineaceae bacterium]